MTTTLSNVSLNSLYFQRGKKGEKSAGQASAAGGKKAIRIKEDERKINRWIDRNRFIPFLAKGEKGSQREKIIY